MLQRELHFAAAILLGKYVIGNQQGIELNSPVNSRRCNSESNAVQQLTLYRLQLLKIFHINVYVESMDVLSEFGCRRLKLEKS